MDINTDKTQLLFIGGFLGAGKTTLLNTLANILKEKSPQIKVGLITNDQAKGLVDTFILNTDETPVQEIAGSCFCCDFNGLMDAALYLKNEVRCNFIIAEPVGSCTDLSATLLQPIKSKYSEDFHLLPLSVLTDPYRLLDYLSDNSKTKEGSGYIYLKQLEEADYIVINKVDSLGQDNKTNIESLLSKRFSSYNTHWISGLEKTGIEEWLTTILQDSNVGRRIAEVDYDIYAEGEAKMGWYNATLKISHQHNLTINFENFNYKWLEMIHQVLEHENISIGHLKSYVSFKDQFLKANITATGRDIKQSGTPFQSTKATAVVNLRAEASHKLIKTIMSEIYDELSNLNFIIEIVELKSLEPGRPEPIFRFNEII